MSCHDNRQPLASLVWWFFLFVCLFVEPFFCLLIYQRRFWFGFFDHLPSWIFLGSSCKPAISLSLHVSSQWDRMKGRIWNKILFECQPAVEEAGILPRENICWSFVRVWKLIQSFGVCLCLDSVDAETPVWLDLPGSAMDAFRGAQTSQQCWEGSISVPCIQEDLSESQRSCLPSPYFSTPLMNGTPHFSERDKEEASTSCPSTIGQDPHHPSSSLIGPYLVKWEHYLIVLSTPAGQGIQDDCPYSPLTSIPTSNFLELGLL